MTEDEKTERSGLYKNLLKSAKKCQKHPKTCKSEPYTVSALVKVSNCEVRLRYGSLLQLDEIL